MNVEGDAFFCLHAGTKDVCAQSPDGTGWASARSVERPAIRAAGVILLVMIGSRLSKREGEWKSITSGTDSLPGFFLGSERSST